MTRLIPQRAAGGLQRRPGLGIAVPGLQLDLIPIGSAGCHQSPITDRQLGWLTRKSQWSRASAARKYRDGRLQLAPTCACCQSNSSPSYSVSSDRSPFSRRLRKDSITEPNRVSQLGAITSRTVSGDSSPTAR